jgi:hypothetical protein
LKADDRRSQGLWVWEFVQAYCPLAVLWVFAARVIPPKPESQVVGTNKHKKLNYDLLILVFLLLCG